MRVTKQRRTWRPGPAGTAEPRPLGPHAPTRRQLLAGGAGLALTAWGLAAPLSRAARAQTTGAPAEGNAAGGDTTAQEEGGDIRFFRIGTGSTAGTYYPVGGILAAAISNPPGSHPCSEGGSCGVPGLLAVAQSTDGSVDNVERMFAGKLESGLCQADVAYWATLGEGVFKDKGPREGLSVIASLYPELLHLVARRGAGIRALADLKGRRVSLDREGSGTRVDALQVLRAAGIKASAIEEVPLTATQAAQAIREGTLDAFFMMAGTPTSVIAGLAGQNLIDLVPIGGEVLESLTELSPFFMADELVAGTYQNLPQTPTVSVRALWLVSTAVSADLVYQITAALWHPTTRLLLDGGHVKARSIRLENALLGVSQPALHEGALRYYRELGEAGPLRE